MTLAELLGELRENLLRDASTLKSGPEDHFWTDATLVRYINEAQRRFARRTFCLADDTTPEVVQVSLRDGVSIYQLHPSILTVVSARHQDAQADLMRLSHPVVFTTANPFVETTEHIGCSTAGQMPLRFTTDEGLQVDYEHQLRMLIEPTPGSTQVGKKVFLRTRRLPLERFKVDKPKQKSEIDDDWNLDTLEWAAWRALRNWDLDAEDRRKAEAHKTRFNEAVAECRHEIQQTKMFQPPTWAFGQGGWSYVR